MYVTLRWVPVTTVVVKKQQLLHIYMCVSVALVIKHAVLYCHLWPLRLDHILSYYLKNGNIFGNKVSEHKMCVLHNFCS